MTDPRPTSRTIAASLARSHRNAALDRGDAVLVGNRAGVVEWTCEAFSQLTGFPLDETLDKPITHFLERAGLEIELVEFVAQHFLDGRTCTVELPFETFDRRSIHVHLEVEPLRDENGDIAHFVAVARDISESQARSAAVPACQTDTRSAAEPAYQTDTRSRRPMPDPVDLSGQIQPPLQSSVQPPVQIHRPTRSLNRRPRSHTLMLSERVSHAIRLAAAAEPDIALFESVLEADLPPLEFDSDRLDALLARLFEAALAHAHADPRACFVTALTGRLAAGRSHRSQVHPIPARDFPNTSQSRIYLEIHDTCPHLARAQLSRIRDGKPGADPRERALHAASEIAQTLGLTYCLDSTPGCGTQSLVLIPIGSS